MCIRDRPHHHADRRRMARRDREPRAARGPLVVAGPHERHLRDQPVLCRGFAPARPARLRGRLDRGRLVARNCADLAPGAVTDRPMAIRAPARGEWAATRKRDGVERRSPARAADTILPWWSCPASLATSTSRWAWLSRANDE